MKKILLIPFILLSQIIVSQTPITATIDYQGYDESQA